MSVVTEPAQSRGVRTSGRPPLETGDWGRETRASRLGALARLLLLIWLGVSLAGLFVALWPISYDLTQGSGFSYEYLLQYQDVWEFFRPIFQRFEELFPQAATSLEQLTTMLSLFWIASFLAYFAAFLVARALPQRWWLGALVLGFMVAFQVALFLMPGTFTTDLFSYVMYGYIPRVYELNPYIYVPGYFPGNRMTSWIHPIWYYTPSIYGPLWLDLSAWVTGFTKDRSMVDQALAYRLISTLAHFANVAVVGLLIRRLAAPRPIALLLLVAWNPLLLFEFAASGHNDSTMLLFLLLAGLFVAYRLHLPAVVSLVAASMVKITPILLLPLLLVHWAGRQRSRRAQVARLLIGGLTFVGLAVALYLPWYAGPDTFQLIDYWSKGPMYMNYIPDLLARGYADAVLDPERLDQAAAWETTRTAVKWLTRIIFVAYFAWELYRLRGMLGVWIGRPDRRAASAPAPVAAWELLGAMSRVFMVFLLLVNTWVLAWYITWPFFLAVALGWERLQTRLATAFTFTAPLMMYNHHYWSDHLTPLLYVVYISPLLLLALPRTRRAAASPEQEPATRAAGEAEATPAGS